MKSKYLRSKPLFIAQLKAAGACHRQVQLFRRLLGSKVNVTEKRCVKHATDFSFSWAVLHLLPYGKTRDQAIAKLNRVEESNWDNRMPYGRFKRRCAEIFARAYLTRAA